MDNSLNLNTHINASGNNCANNSLQSSDGEQIRQGFVSDEQHLQFSGKSPFKRQLFQEHMLAGRYKHPFPPNIQTPTNFQHTPYSTHPNNRLMNYLLPPVSSGQHASPHMPIPYPHPPMHMMHHHSMPQPMRSPINGQFMIRHPVKIPAPVQNMPPMVNRSMAFPPLRIMPQQLLPSMLTNETNVEMTHSYKYIENKKLSVLSEMANQCSLLYSAVKDRNVLSFLGLKVNKPPQCPQITSFCFDQLDVPYKEISTDTLWNYIKRWRGNMFELNPKVAKDGYKVAIDPTVLTLLSSLIEMKLVDLLSELVEVSSDTNRITMEHLQTCIQKKPFDIGLESIRKIERLAAQISGQY